MFKKKQPARMTAFTKKNIKHLLDDLRLYSGNICYDYRCLRALIHTATVTSPV